MTEDEALALMVAPSDKRPTWGQGILQIFLTRACDKSCYACTQGSNLGGKPVMITVAEFEQAVSTLSDYFGIVGIFGGNPCIHPDFPEICSLLRKYVPKKEQRGLWSNNLMGHGAVARQTFHAPHSNLNVHMDQQAYDEFWRDWPESRRVLKGLKTDSRHSPPFVAMTDLARLPVFDYSNTHRALTGYVPNTLEERHELIAHCDINQLWSAMVCPVPGRGLRGYFCEIAGAQAMLHAHDPDWPDTGVEVTPGWWKRPMSDFKEQVRWHCHRCGVPLRRYGQLALTGGHEEVSPTHQAIYKPKVKDRKVALVTRDGGQSCNTLARATDYIQNGALK